jgi:hypothetical protein
VLGEAADLLWSLPRDGEPGDRPVVGVTGDLYTRVNPLGNAGLFRRLERKGCEVWPNPYFAQMTDLATTQDLPRMLRRLQPRKALDRGLSRALTAARRRGLVRALSPAVRSIALEPAADRLLELARPYVDPGTIHLILLGVAKIADFLSRGATGVINAAGINCMVGTAIDSAVARIRADHRQAPVITLLYGGSEGPAQRIRLETFIHQVMELRGGEGIARLPTCGSRWSRLSPRVERRSLPHGQRRPARSAVLES